MPGHTSLGQEEFIMPVWLTVIIVILVVVLAVIAILYFWGSRMQRKQVEQQQLMDQMAQTVSMLVIDKKLMKMKESGLPSQVIEQTPWYMKRAKVPVVKAKVGNRIMVMVADNSAYAVLPVKCEAKVVISGIYIREVKSVRGQTIKTPEKKKTFFSRFRRSKNKDGKGKAAKNTQTAKGKKK